MKGLTTRKEIKGTQQWNVLTPAFLNRWVKEKPSRRENGTPTWCITTEIGKPKWKLTNYFQIGLSSERPSLLVSGDREHVGWGTMAAGHGWKR